MNFFPTSKIAAFFFLNIITIILSSCGDPSDVNGSKEQLRKEKNETNRDEIEDKKSDCNCSQSDAEFLANKIVIDFAKSQLDVESQYARRIRLDKLERRSNCTWVAVFEISYPFGNTDGMHPSEFIKKRFACDGVEIYAQ